MTTDAPPETLQETPLAAAHERLGARMVPFGGWRMPVQYTGILDEHRAVREAAGLFDISHMGEFIARGPQALAALNTLLTNDTAKLSIGTGQYTLLLNERGGVIDDMIIYQTGPEEVFLVVNASMIEPDFAWMAPRMEKAGASLENQSAQTAAAALQGPRSREIFAACFGTSIPAPEKNQIIFLDWRGHAVRCACTGYTGEDGAEFFFPAEVAEEFWTFLLEKGAPFGLKPCGLGARDTLRLEACYPLNGNDLSPEKTPLEAGLGIFVSLKKKADFPGKGALAAQKEQGVPTKLAAFRMTGKSAPPRAHYPLWANGQQVGEAASGTLSPTLGIGIGMAYLPTALAQPGQELEVEIRGTRAPAVVVQKPFYKRA